MSMDELDLGARTDFQVPHSHPESYCDASPISGPARRVSNSRCRVPWPAAWSSAHNLEASIQSRALRAGTISRLRCLATAAVPLAADIERPREDSVFALHVMSGELTLEHDGHECIVRSGGVIVFDAARPTRLNLGARSKHDILALTVPTHRLLRRGFHKMLPHSFLVAGSEHSSILSGSLSLIAKQMLVPSEDELDVVFDACLSLLALASRDRVRNTELIEVAQDNAMLRAIIEYVDQNIAATTLSPSRVSERFSISTRYLHKLFGKSGTTFCAYILNRRLDQIHGELGSDAAGRPPIGPLALKWGFADISTFNRAFKKRFGCTPRRVRAGTAR